MVIMFTDDELSTMPHPLRRAWLLQEHLKKLKNEIEGTTVEYNQIVWYLKNLGLKEDDHYLMLVKPSERRHLLPEKFKELFPEANDTLLQIEHTAMIEDAKKLLESKVIPGLTLDNAKMYVGDKEITKACEVVKTEKITFVQKL
jgi:hypothetical protein